MTEEASFASVEGSQSLDSLSLFQLRGPEQNWLESSMTLAGRVELSYAQQ